MKGEDEKRKNDALIYKAVSLLLILSAIFLVYYIYQHTGDTTVKMDNRDIAVFETNYGTFKVQLFINQTPITAGNFRKLVDEGFYDRTKFHRVIDGFMVQGGDPKSKDDTDMIYWGSGGPNYTIEDEFVKGLSNVRGTIAMANTGQPNSGGSQFFINVANNTNLDFDKPPYTSKHPVFGKVIVGMETVDEISKADTTGRPSDRPLENIIVHRVYMQDGN